MAETPLSPWLTAKQAAEYLHRGRRTVIREIKAGRLRGAIVGQRGGGEVLTRKEWCDAWVDEHTVPVELPTRRRA
jgi:excisionase family DNA binding protein